MVEKAEDEHRLNEEELAALLASPEAEEDLAVAADRVRAAYVGNGVHLRGLIEFSNICRQNCFYCGLRRDNARVERYRLTPEEILRLAEKARGYGYKTVVLQGGEDTFFTVDVLAPLLREIRALGLVVTLSIGERSEAEYRALREAGASRFLLRIETTDRELYTRLDPGMCWEMRRDCLVSLRRLGYEVGTGSLVGLPGQTVESLARDILFFQALDADMVGIGPFIPNGDTPLAGSTQGDIRLVRRMVSLLRLLLPEANIPATTAMETVERGARRLMLASGANVVMPNVTEGDYRRRYALYPGKACVSDTPEGCRNCMGAMLESMGRFVAEDAGFRRRGGRLEAAVSFCDKDLRCLL